jgi:hypothetical protein
MTLSAGFTVFSAFVDGASGADSGAGPAVDAGVSVNLVVGVALRDCAYRALALAAAAADAFVADYICHFRYTSLNV